MTKILPTNGRALALKQSTPDDLAFEYLSMRCDKQPPSLTLF
jgi:hypothetical protein